jgi:hypothetical protein
MGSLVRWLIGAGAALTVAAVAVLIAWWAQQYDRWLYHLEPRKRPRRRYAR